jgi:DnaD/phage-associated family protein
MTVKTFSGFPPGKVRNVGIPEPFFTELAPLIDDLAELKVTLHLLWRLGQQRGRVRYVRHADLLGDRVLLSGLGERPKEALESALQRAIERGTLLQAGDILAETPDALYFANTPRGRAAVAAIARGEWPGELEAAGRLNIFALYEQNIGALTPIIADELREAEQTYPGEWVEDAFREAVSLNKRSWRYIRAILDRWLSEGRDDAAGRRPDQADRRRYIEGKYGEYIEH